ncbi:MAG: amidohydrolase family protein [Bacteroidetes bacterium]|nr:amidohydrolase family protein [Bacteroidota bacterium]
MLLTRRLIALLLFLLLAPLLHAQGIAADTPLRPVTRTFAITNARVVQAPGQVLERATIVVRDGVIEAVGANVLAPNDAEIIEGDSLTVYAGFIDAFSHVGVSEVEEDEDDIADPGNPTNDRAGIMPQRDVRTMLDPSAGSIKDLRNIGFTVAHVVPEGRMLPGQGVAILLREPQRFEDAQGVVLTGPLSLYAQFERSEGVYPGTPMGILAKMRDLFIEARRRRTSTNRYSSDPEGRTRPAYDPVLVALQEILDANLPMYFRVENTNEAFRALNITEELGLPMVLVGLPWSTPLTNHLADRGIPSIVPLALPDTVAADTTALAIPVAIPAPGASVSIQQRRARSHRDLENERAALRAQRAASVGRYESNAATLQDAEIPFAFSTYEVKTGDIRANLRRMIAAGLSTDDALAALTTSPAELLGLGMLGTVEEGMMANLVLTDGDYFEEDTEVLLVFVEGVKYEIEEEEELEGADPDAVVDPAGTWAFSVATPDGEVEGTFTITGSETSLTGTIRTDETRDLKSVTLEGNVLSFTFTQPEMGSVRVSGVIDGDSFSGTASVGSMGSFSMTATRRPG